MKNLREIAMNPNRFGGMATIVVVMTILSTLAWADSAPLELAYSGRVFESGCGYDAAPQSAAVTLWTAATGGSQVGGTLNLSNVAVNDGLISVF
ncbi:MAG: hypothetical protein C4523_06400, partial [Myxococcales bacterium]